MVNKQGTQSDLYGFDAEYQLWTWRNPLPPYERVLGSLAHIAISIRARAKHAFFSIRAIREGEGRGRTALTWLCALADKYGVTLVSEVRASGALTNEQLLAWYKRNGFASIDDADPLWIERKPKAHAAIAQAEGGK